MNQSIFDLPCNPYLLALLRIERYAHLKNQIGNNRRLWKSAFKETLSLRNSSILFLVKKGLMDTNGSLTAIFSTENPNPLISDAALYVQNTFQDLEV